MTEKPRPEAQSTRPVMVLLDLISRRWTLRIIWELRGAPMTSRGLRTACDNASPTVLHARLSDLRDAGLVELRTGEGYALTPMGREFQRAFLPLYAFAEHWAATNPGTTTTG